MKKKISTLITFIIATSVFYLLLVLNVFHIGKTLVPSSEDYLNSDMPEAQQDREQTYLETDPIDVSQTGHFAANDITNLQNLCDTINICDKIQFNGIFTDADKYIYTKTISKIIGFVDTNSHEEKQIENVIDTIKINKNNGTRRGYATRDTIIFNLGSVQSKKEFIELSAHEMGHITDLGYIQGTSYKKDRNFTEFGKVVFAINDLSLSFYKLSRDKETIRKAEVKKKDFCSGYGMSDPFEDFAECFNLYINHNTFFKQIAKTNSILKNKYNIIAGIFNGKYISTTTKDLILIKNDSTRRPRDTTKLSTN